MNALKTYKGTFTNTSKYAYFNKKEKIMQVASVWLEVFEPSSS